LRHVEGVFPVPNDLVGQVENTILMTLDERAERIPVPARSLFYQRPVVGAPLRTRHPT
jgi:hypothetical protein